MPHQISFPPLIELQQTDSTNNYAMNLVRQGMAKDGQTILAYHQTEGKGQHGKKWVSQEGKGLNLSICLQPQRIQPIDGFQLLAATALATVKRVHKLTGQHFHIKWPNDLYWNDRKAGGILIQSAIKGEQWDWAIIGIGINVMQQDFPQDLPNPVSLYQISGLTFNLKALAEEIREEILNTTSQLFEDGFEEIYSAYSSLLYKKGEWIQFKVNDETIEGIFIEVTKDGRLQIENNTTHIFHFGEIEWIL